MASTYYFIHLYGINTTLTEYTEQRAEECSNSAWELENQTETGYMTLGKLFNCFSVGFLCYKVQKISTSYGNC